MGIDILSLCLTNVDGSRASGSAVSLRTVNASESALSGKVCKICYDDEQSGSDDHWVHPCRCSGTLHWVHEGCFGSWLKQAPFVQQFQCQICKYVYRKVWVLKHYRDWCLPPVRISKWDCIEIFLDFYSTYKFVRGLVWTFEGRRSVWMQMLHFCFWRMFIASNRRLAYYASLGRALLMSIFDIRTQDYEQETEKDEAGGGEGGGVLAHVGLIVGIPAIGLDLELEAPQFNIRFER